MSNSVSFFPTHRDGKLRKLFSGLISDTLRSFLPMFPRLSRFSRFSKHRVLKQRTTLANNYFTFYYPPREGSSYRITSVTLASVHSFIWLASKENGSFVLTSSSLFCYTGDQPSREIRDRLEMQKQVIIINTKLKNMRFSKYYVFPY